LGPFRAGYLMKIPMRSRAASTAVVIPAVIIVIVLAALQYRWSDQISEATSIRLADSLQMSMINWHLDFFRDFSEICLTMHIDPESGQRGDGDQYIRRFAEWKSRAVYPLLVSDLYLLTSDDGARTRVLRLNPSTRRFEADPEPSQFAPLREAVEQGSLNVAPAVADSAMQQPREPRPQTPGQQFVSRFYPGDPLAGWLFEPNIPALLHPIVRTAASGASGPRANRNAVDWIVMELNNHVIQAQILPDLAQRYFQGTDGLDYQLAVVAGSKPVRVIYSSDPGFGDPKVVDADGTMDVFGRLQDKALGSPIRIFHKPSENKGPAASVGISWFQLVEGTPASQDWQLIVKHRRGGPLGAFVAEMRRRDLTISFGVLSLLVISMAMLIITSHRAQRLAKLQMDFVTAVSHELRTPLTVISSAADNIAHGVVEGKQQLTQYGSVIGSQARQLFALVEQILLFASTRGGQQRYSLRPLEVSEIIDTALASTAGLIRTSRFTIEREISPDVPPVMGDLAALSQCLQNLITNALKYGSEQRWIGIRARFGEHGVRGKEIQISVADRGIGIGSSDLSHIFEPFYRSPSVTAAQIRGTGLGLPLAKSIALAMKGYLTVTSVPGRGSTFTLHLPSLERPVAQAVEAGAAAPR
jgi:signal transduction histidine kinase